MSKRDLTYRSVQDVIHDVQRLKQGHKQHGNWTLRQASWHCRTAIERCLQEIPAGAQSTTEQIEMQKSAAGADVRGRQDAAWPADAAGG